MTTNPSVNSTSSIQEAALRLAQDGLSATVVGSPDFRLLINGAAMPNAMRPARHPSGIQ
jgi:hypothetical protein